MKCKKHFTDLSSVVGVCASCLRERLFVLIEAQAQVQAQIRPNHRSSDFNQPELVFPRSVSPYVSCRKSDSVDAATHHGRTLSDQRFYSTPQVGPNGVNISTGRKTKLSLFSNFFSRSSNKSDLVDLKSRDSSTTTSLPWLPIIFASKRKKKMCAAIFDPNASRVSQRPCRGLSPAVESDDECGRGSSGCTTESSPRWKETPQRAAQFQRNCKRLNQARNGSGLKFCLSPLVRASPNRHRNVQPEVSVTGDSRAPGKPYLGDASSFCANRSRKLANFGRFHPKY